MSQRIDEIAGVPLTPHLPDNLRPAECDFAVSRKIKQELLAELRSGWETGHPVTPEDLLGHWPGNPDTDPDVASLLFEDYCQRRKRGQEPDPAEYGSRFPEHQAAFASLSNQQSLLQSLGVAPRGGGTLLALPTDGDELFGFLLIAELGRGSFARVFLAEQIGLAGRRVVVKVSAIEGEEPSTLAQLQHTHIMPIYSVHEDEAAGLRAVCMPYFGGASLSRILEFLSREGARPTRGSQFVHALSAVASPWTVGAQRETPSENQGPLSLLSSFSFVRAAVWIVARLAEGLQHAHLRKVLHRDIKPSNVLIGADGQPMLLDFNLSQNLCSDQAQAEATLGGTVAYMAPEHLRALATRDPALARQVDRRADIYGLGMVLYEILTGQRPFDQSGSYSPIPAIIEAMARERGRTVPSLRAQRPDISWSLESIARKCLAPDPADRYQQAEHLAEDLRRCLEDRPLKFAPELSWPERIGKWVRRHPRVAAIGSIALAALLIVAGGAAILLATLKRLESSEARVRETEGAEARELKSQFLAGAERTRCLLNTTSDLGEHLAEGVSLCEHTLAHYGILQGNRLEEHRTWPRLQPEEQASLAEDTRELLLLLARARVQTATAAAAAELLRIVITQAWAPAGLSANQFVSLAAGLQCWKSKESQLRHRQTSALERALTLLDQAATIDGLESAAALCQDRANYLESLGYVEQARAARERAEAAPPTSARDHYLLASHHASRRQYAEALAELKKALQLRPEHYWSWFNQGHCHYEMQDYALAVGDFTACIALWPSFGWGYLNRALALERLGKGEEALDDYAFALKFNPELIQAHLGRGACYLVLNKPLEALADYDTAANRGRDDVTVHAGRGIALEALGRFPEADEAFARAWQRNPNHVDSLLGYAFIISGRRPKEAQAAFAKVLEREPRNVRALYGYAMLLTQPARGSAAALACLSLAIQADPTFVAGRRARANVLAHRGDWDQACQDLEWCIATEPTGINYYAAACVYALMAEKRSDVSRSSLATHALLLLQEALKRGYGQDKAPKDTDLRSIWSLPEFRQLLDRGG
jgi:serine/threonine protein kinase/tetratricopeptide (TPR) repeat protein